MTSAGWYLRRLSRMGPAEVAGRAMDTWRIQRGRRVAEHHAVRANPLPSRRFAAVLPEGSSAAVAAVGAGRLVATADEIMDGRIHYLGHARDDLVNPDWSLDPGSGRRAPADAYAFDIPYRNELAVGNIKQIWELSRHQHLTVLAAAYAVTGDERYAERIADHLKTWWAANPPMRGVHWVSGIELGIRLISWVWVRRLLEGWPGAPSLFEDNAEALNQIWHHQRWLATYRSRGSSANNHVIAEAAGQLVAACAFGWFPESARWRSEAMRTLDVQLRRNTFEFGLNRELATEYHALVLELGLAATIEAEAAGIVVPESTWLVLLRMTDALAAMLDCQLRPPRQGDGDDGHGLVVDGSGANRWASLLGTGQALFGRLPWWPTVPGHDVRTPLLSSLARRRRTTFERRAEAYRSVHFADAGMTILRTPPGSSNGEIWCRCDGGPHGFLAIAAHAHADALSIEVRQDGVEVLADPGTFCYHGSPEWRSYFRSTLGHNTVELDGVDQSRSGGPFLWTRHARTHVLIAPSPGDVVQRWQAEHDGYRRRGAPVVHRRTVELDASTGDLLVNDEIMSSAPHPCRLAFHLGPSIAVDLTGSTAWLSWTHGRRERSALLTLPPELTWATHRGQVDPPLGWYSPGLGQKEASSTLVGSGLAGPGGVLTTHLRFGT